MRLGILDRPENRRTGWQARTLHRRPLGKPSRTRQEAAARLRQHLGGVRIDHDT